MNFYRLFSLPFLKPRSQRAQSFYQALVIVLATAFFGWVVNLHYPLEHWLLPIYLKVWAYSLLFGGACLVAGWRILGMVLPTSPRPGERFVFAIALGVLTFYCGMFVAGLLGLYGHGLFWAWPVLLVAFGGPRFLSDTRGLRRRLRDYPSLWFQPRGQIEVLCVALMLLAVVGIYITILPPQNICYDSRWYHLPIAEDCVATGGIRRNLGWRGHIGRQTAAGISRAIRRGGDVLVSGFAPVRLEPGYECRPHTSVLVGSPRG